MTYNNPHYIDISDDTQDVLMASLSEVDGQPVLHAVFSLKAHRQYDPDIHGVLLNGMPPRFMVPLHPYEGEDTAKQRAIEKQATKLSQQVVTASKSALEQPAQGDTLTEQAPVPPAEDVPTQVATPPEDAPSIEQTEASKKDGKG